jgi:arylsulfatase A-like enzyme
MRERVWLLGLLGLVLACGTRSRPSFVVLIADDQRWDGLGVVQRELGEEARSPWIETPQLDRLADEGVRFRHAFVVTSLCSPARASLLTGRYPHEHGILDNRSEFPADLPTYASALRGAGYRTGYVGKWHMGVQAGPRPGFDYSASYTGQGRYFDATFELDGERTGTTGFIDDVATDFAIEFIRAADEPFLLVLGFKAPHGPRESPPRLRELYVDERMRPPRSAEHRPPFLDQPAYAPDSAGRIAAGGPERSRRVEESHRENFRLIAALDENLGRLREALRELGRDERTVIVFTSDNGYLIEEHGLGGKRFAYEESIRVPLLVHDPRLRDALRGRALDELVLDIDLAPSLLSLAGEPIANEMQGRSWAPLLTSEAISWRDAFLYEYFFSPDFRAPPILALRTASAKLIRYPGHPAWTEVFDLAADPYERRNLAASRPELRAELEHRLELEASAVDYRVPEHAPPQLPLGEGS